MFLHIPKNAGTTICLAMYGRHVGHRTALWYRTADPELFKSKFKFAVVRDPVDRFVSAFNFMLTGGTEEVRASKKGTQLVSRYPNILDFIGAVEKNNIINFTNIDSAFHSQSEYLTDQHGTVIVDNLYRLENISGAQLNVPGLTIDMSIFHNTSKKYMDNFNRTKIEDFVRKHYADDYRIIKF